MKHLVVIVLLASLQMACSDKSVGIHNKLGVDEDGLINSEIGASEDFPELEDTPPELILANKLSQAEAKLINDMHGGREDRVSFLVVNAETEQVVRSYRAQQPRRLASVTKIPTGLAALRNVRNVEVPKVKSMLKSSNNSEASRYVRLAAKALDGFVAPGTHYSNAHSCPSTISQEQGAARRVLDWLKESIDDIDWEDAFLFDGAGCGWDNRMTALQTVYVLRFADRFGDDFAGYDFEELLSIAGVDGTWRNRNTESKGFIFAKTGTLTPTSNLAGYFYVKRGGEVHKYYFTLFVEKSGGGSVTTRARQFIEAMMRNWISQLAKSEGPSLAEI